MIATAQDTPPPGGQGTGEPTVLETATLDARGHLDGAAALASQVAHDLGNVLTVVLGNAELLAETLAEQPAAAALLARMLRAAQRGTVLVDRLDLLARGVSARGGPTDVASLLAGYADRLAPGLPAGVAFEVVAEPGLGAVALDTAALSLALDELVENALAALGGAGRLSILAARLPGAPGSIGVTVADDGPGMAAPMLRRCAVPTFAAGTAAHRTGLGLAIAGRVAAAAGGRLVLASRQGAGTRATLDLPAA
jgi:signal transduction histidine kinase